MIGALRHRVTIEQKTAAPDGGGGFAESWNALATVWAAIETLEGAEILRAEQIMGETRFRLRIRYRGDVTAAMRVQFGSRVLGIEAVADADGRGRYLVLSCVEDRPS
jgi:SPP1 family predicted phage head-tail adaptor